MGDEDSFVFQAEAGDEVSLILQHSGSCAALRLFGPDLKLVDEDKSSGTLELENVRLNQAGEYTVQVDDWGTPSTFSYTLHIGPNLR